MEQAFRVGLGLVGTKNECAEEDKEPEWDDDAGDNGAYEYKDQEVDDGSGAADAEAQELLPSFFIGDYRVAKSEEALRRYQITHILSVAPLEPAFDDEMFGNRSNDDYRLLLF